MGRYLSNLWRWKALPTPVAGVGMSGGTPKGFKYFGKPLGSQVSQICVSAPPPTGVLEAAPPRPLTGYRRAGKGPGGRLWGGAEVQASPSPRRRDLLAGSGLLLLQS